MQGHSGTSKKKKTTGMFLPHALRDSLEIQLYANVMTDGAEWAGIRALTQDLHRSGGFCDDHRCALEMSSVSLSGLSSAEPSKQKVTDPLRVTLNSHGDQYAPVTILQP